MFSDELRPLTSLRAAGLWHEPAEDPWRELIRAVVKRAGYEARSGNVEAIYWLKEDAQDTYVPAAGIDSRKVLEFAREAQGRVIRRTARQIMHQLTKGRKQA